jgi:hypothetical protein
MVTTVLGEMAPLLKRFCPSLSPTDIYLFLYVCTWYVGCLTICFLIALKDITALDGPVPDDGDDTWEDVADAIVPSQTNRFRSKRK